MKPDIGCFQWIFNLETYFTLSKIFLTSKTPIVWNLCPDKIISKTTVLDNFEIENFPLLSYDSNVSRIRSGSHVTLHIGNLERCLTADRITKQNTFLPAGKPLIFAMVEIADLATFRVL